MIMCWIVMLGYHPRFLPPADAKAHLKILNHKKCVFGYDFLFCILKWKQSNHCNTMWVDAESIVLGASVYCWSPAVFVCDAAAGSRWRLENVPRSPSLLSQWRGLTVRSRVAVTSRSPSAEGSWTAWTGRRPSTSLSTISVMRTIGSWETTISWEPQVISIQYNCTSNVFESYLWVGGGQFYDFKATQRVICVI